MSVRLEFERPPIKPLPVVRAPHAETPSSGNLEVSGQPPALRERIQITAHNEQTHRLMPIPSHERECPFVYAQAGRMERAVLTIRIVLDSSR